MPVWIAALRGGVESPELLYPVDDGIRFSRKTGVAPIAIVCLPALPGWLHGRALGQMLGAPDRHNRFMLRPIRLLGVLVVAGVVASGASAMEETINPGVGIGIVGRSR